MEFWHFLIQVKGEVNIVFMKSRKHVFNIYLEHCMKNISPTLDFILKYNVLDNMELWQVTIILLNRNEFYKRNTLDRMQRSWCNDIMSVVDIYNQMFTLVLVCNITLCCKLHYLFSFMFTFVQCVQDQTYYIFDGVLIILRWFNSDTNYYNENEWKWQKSPMGNIQFYIM